jgi:hypothetical protein
MLDNLVLFEVSKLKNARNMICFLILCIFMPFEKLKPGHMLDWQNLTGRCLRLSMN